jgi:hypothetical protein
MIIRVASLLVAAGYVALALFATKAQNRELVVVEVIVAVVAALPLIWFGDALGRYVGPAEIGYINRPTPGIFVAIGGWILLLVVPAALIAVAW